MKTSFVDAGIPLNPMDPEAAERSRYADTMETAPKGLISKISNMLVEMFSEKHQARMVIAESNRISLHNGEPVYISFRDILGNDKFSET